VFAAFSNESNAVVPKSRTEDQLVPGRAVEPELRFQVNAGLLPYFLSIVTFCFSFFPVHMPFFGMKL